MKTLLLASIAVSGLLVSVAAAGPSGNGSGKSPQVETVSGFAMKLVAALGLETVDERGAVVSLRALGCRLDEPSGPLTEGRAVAIMADLGLRVLPPADPAKPVSSARATALAAVTGMTMAATVTPPSPTDGITLPTQCLAERNHGQCIDCCKEAVHCSANGSDLFACNVCAQFCKNNLPPPPSDPEPQP